MLLLPLHLFQTDWLDAYMETWKVDSFGLDTEACEYLNQAIKMYFSSEKWSLMAFDDLWCNAGLRYKFYR